MSRGRAKPLVFIFYSLFSFFFFFHTSPLHKKRSRKSAPPRQEHGIRRAVVLPPVLERLVEGSKNIK